MLSNCTYDVPTPQSWSDGLKVRKGLLLDDMTVTDWNAGSMLFTYYEFPAAQPLLIQSIEGDRWITVFEKPGLKRDNSVVKIEQIAENEYRVVITPASTVVGP
jgi:hypothetical protein